jgi:hypothetical protein
MVGTSSGGMVLGRAAEVARRRIARLVFVDALALFNGERICDVVKLMAVPNGLTTGPTREDMEHRLLAGLDPVTRAWALDRYTLHPIGIHDPVRLEGFWAQKWQARCLVPPREESRKGASAPHRGRLNAKMTEAGHRPLSDAQHAG